MIVVITFLLAPLWMLALCYALLRNKLELYEAIQALGGLCLELIWDVRDVVLWHAPVFTRVMDAVMTTLYAYLTWKWWNRRGRKRFAERVFGYKARAIRAKLLRLAPAS